MSTFYKYRDLENWNDLFVKVPVKAIMLNYIGYTYLKSTT